jgi:excinuclease UvrABC ATPase subunit
MSGATELEKPLAIHLSEAKHIGQLAELSVEKSIDFFENLSLGKEDTKIAGNVMKNVRDRLKFLKGVGLGYMTLARRSNTLSGGESQRIRLATQVGHETRRYHLRPRRAIYWSPSS